MASTLGVSRWRQLKDIVWPLARPGYFAGAIIVFIWALTDLGTPLLVGYQDTMPVRIFSMVTDVNENPVGYALVFLVILITVAIFLASKFLFANKKYEMMARGHVSGAVKKISAAAATPFYVMLVATVFVALLPHVSVLITSLSDNWFMTVLPEQYTTKYYQAVFGTDMAVTGIQNSFLQSAA
jgi:iron(III) transport system permease protein